MEFEWTDENVKEFIGKYFNTSAPVIGGKNLEVLLSYFKHKKSKEPKREYEILSYTFQKRVYNKNNFGEFCCGFDVPVQSLLLHPEYMKTIYSVKRLSDGEIFTVGDDYGSSKIEGFKIDTEFNGGLCAISHKGSSLSSLYSLEKVKQPLFTTEDGVEITDEKQTLYAVLTKAQWETREDTVKRMKERSSFSTPLNPAWKYFSTDEVRLHYIIRNKPSLSWNDVFNLFRDNGSSTSKFLDAVFEKSKSKITNP